MQVRMRGISIVVGLVLAGGVSAVTPSDGTGQVLAADTPSITATPQASGSRLLTRRSAKGRPRRESTLMRHCERRAARRSLL